MEFYFTGVRPIFIEGRRLACVLFSGCDFRCRHCYNSDILEFRKESLFPLAEARSQIAQGGYDGVLFAGGEPCLQRQALLSLARFSRQAGKEVWLQTNGSRPEVLSLLLSHGLLDKVIIDMKAPFDETFEKVTRSKTFFKSSSEVMAGVKSSIALLAHASIPARARTVIVPSLMFRKEDLLAIARIVHSHGLPWELVPFMPGRTADIRLTSIKAPSPGFLQNLLEIIGNAYPGMDVSLWNKIYE